MAAGEPQGRLYAPPRAPVHRFHNEPSTCDYSLKDPASAQVIRAYEDTPGETFPGLSCFSPCDDAAAAGHGVDSSYSGPSPPRCHVMSSMPPGFKLLYTHDMQLRGREKQLQRPVKCAHFNLVPLANMTVPELAARAQQADCWQACAQHAAGEQALHGPAGSAAGGAASAVRNPFDDPDLEGVAEYEVRQLHVCASEYNKRTRDPNVAMMLDDIMTSVAVEKLRKADLAAPHNVPRTWCWLRALEAASAGARHDDGILPDLGSVINVLEEALGIMEFESDGEQTALPAATASGPGAAAGGVSGPT